jgi:hypothetical protein
MRPHVASIVFWICLLNGGVHVARAEDRRGIVILSAADCCRQKAWPKAEEMVQKELLLLDIPVTFMSAKSVEEPAAGTELLAMALETRADAVLSLFLIRDDSTRVAVRIYDRITDKTVYRTWPIDLRDTDIAIVTGLRVVDTLRASFLEARMVKQIPEPERRPTELKELVDSTTLRSDRMQRLSLSAGWAVAADPRGGVFLSGFDAALGWHPLTHGAVELQVRYLSFGNDITKGGVTSDIDLLIVRGWLVWHIIDSGRIRPAVNLGAGGLIVFAEGTEGDEQRLKSDNTRVGVIALGAALRLVISTRIHLKLDIDAGLTLPAVRLMHDTVLATTLGRPLLEGALALVVNLP